MAMLLPYGLQICTVLTVNSIKTGTLVLNEQVAQKGFKPLKSNFNKASILTHPSCHLNLKLWVSCCDYHQHPLHHSGWIDWDLAVCHHWMWWCRVEASWMGNGLPQVPWGIDKILTKCHSRDMECCLFGSVHFGFVKSQGMVVVSKCDNEWSPTFPGTWLK